jgi:hypothetical protein
MGQFLSIPLVIGGLFLFFRTFSNSATKKAD